MTSPRRSRASASDRPDTRFGLELHDLGEALAGTEFKVFAGALGAGGSCAGSTPGRASCRARSSTTLTELAKQHGAKGLVWAFVQERGRGARRSRSSSRPREIAAVERALRR